MGDWLPANFHFLRPWALWGLVPLLPLIVFAHWRDGWPPGAGASTPIYWQRSPSVPGGAGAYAPSTPWRWRWHSAASAWPAPPGSGNRCLWWRTGRPWW